MGLINNSGVQIHYEVEGSGPSLVLVHGFSHNFEQWRYLKFVEALKNDSQLILVDARGHGASDKPTDATAYDLELLSSDVVSVLDALSISKADYFGYSLGGYVGFGLAKYAPDRFRSLAIGGMHPYKRDAGRYVTQIARLNRGMEHWVQNVEANGGFRFPEDKQIVLANEPQALIALSKAMMLDPEIAPALSSTEVPCLILAGENDPYFELAQECVSHMPRARFAGYPEKDHQTALNAELNLPNLRELLSEARCI